MSRFSKKMRFLSKLNLSLFFLLTIAVGTNALSQESLSAHYLLKPKILEGKIEVELVLTNVTAKLNICLPAFGQRPGERFILEDIRTDDGAIAIHINERACFIVPNNYKNLILKYNLLVTKKSDKNSWLASSLSPRAYHNAMYFPGESIFLELVENPSAKAYIKVQMQPHEDFSSSLAQNDSLISSNFNNVHSSYFAFYPKFKRATLINADTELRFSLQADIEQSISQLSEVFSKLLDIYTLWTPSRQPPILNILILPAANENNALAGFSRSQGIVLQLGSEKNHLSFSSLYLIAHELFHIYNGESLRFSQNGYKESAWFREGLTNYLALCALKEAKLITINEENLQIKKHAELYRDYQTKSKKDENISYHLGFFMAMTLDQHLRQSSQNKLHLTGFWRFLATSSLWEREHDNDSLGLAIELYSGLNYRDFIRRYAENSETLPIERLFISN